MMYIDDLMYIVRFNKAPIIFQTCPNGKVVSSISVKFNESTVLRNNFYVINCVFDTETSSMQIVNEHAIKINKSAIGRYWKVHGTPCTCPHSPLPERSPLQWLQLHPVIKMTSETNHSIGETWRNTTVDEQNHTKSIEILQIVGFYKHFN